MSKELKQIRGQIRQIVKEVLPEVMTQELIAAIEKHLVTQLKEGLQKIDDRQKDLQSYYLRTNVKPDSNKS